MDTLINILHLEDALMDAELIQAKLEAADLTCRITLAQTRDEFETALGEGRIDIILADYRLPAYDGMSALRTTLARRPEIPFVFVSGTMGEEAAIEALTQGATDYVLKHNLSRLPSAVQRALLEAKNLHERRQAENALAESESKMRSILENIGIGVSLISPDMQILELNKCMREWFPNIDPGQQPVCYQSFNAPPRDQICSYCPTTKTLKDGLVHEAITQTPQGEQVRNYRIVATPLRNASGEIVAAIEMVDDITEIRQTQEALNTSNTLLRTIIESAPVAIIDLDLEGCVHSIWNPAAERMLGWKAKEVVGTPLLAVAEESHEAFRRCLEQISQGANLEGVEVRGKRHDGVPIDYCIYASPLHDAKGGISGSIAVLVDITERKHADAFIRKLSQAIEQSPVSIVITDNNGTIEFVNKKFTQITGYSFSEAVGQNPNILKSGETEISEYRQLWKTIRSGGVWRGEFHNRKKSGGLFWEQATIAPVRNSENRITHFVAVKEDVTERKRAEATIREKQKFIRNILDSVDEGFIVVDKQYRIRSANRAFCEMYHATEAEILNRPCYKTTHNSMRPCYELGEDCAVRRTFITGKGHSTTHTHENENGQKQHIELKTYPITDDSGKVVSVIETFNDVTEKRKLEQQLMQAQKMESVGRLAGGIAHDFNNMLGVITGHSEMSLDEIDEDSPFFDSFNEILNAAKRSGDLTRQLLAFARQQVISPKIMDLNETVGGMTKILRRLIGEDIVLTWEPGKTIWPVKMDPAQIDQILVNLCVNSRDAISGVGSITIKTENATFDEDYCAAHPETNKGDYLKITIGDDGCGMNSATLENIFDPFFTTKEMGKGTGLGLATVYGIVKQNGGFIYVASEPESGTIFEIYLPRHIENEQVAEKDRRSRSIIRGHETILLVEDNPAFLNMTRLMLENMGYQVYSAATPSEAIRIVDSCKNDIDLLITDVVMPEMSGRELANRLHQRRPSIRHLFMSGYTGDLIAHRGVLDEGIQFIQKPFSVQDLSAKISEILKNDRGDTRF